MRQLSLDSVDSNGSNESDENELDLQGKPEVCDELKLKNLIKRQKVYGDITQNASHEELENLLRYYENNVPQVRCLSTFFFSFFFHFYYYYFSAVCSQFTGYCNIGEKGSR